MNGKFFHIVLTAVICLMLAILAWFGLVARPGQKAAEELSRLAAELSAVIIAEDLGPDRSQRVRASLGILEPQGEPGRELLLGARAFLADQPREAERHFTAALAAAPDEPRVLSFKAAANLRLGNPALATELYGRALTLKHQAEEGPVDMSYDRLGLALGLFMLGRPVEAAPLAEEAWRDRSGHLGPGAPATLSAATRLATIYVALNRPAQAETLLKEVLPLTEAGGSETSAALEESRLLLTVLYNQSGRQAQLPELFERKPADSGGSAMVGVQDAIKALRPKTVTSAELEEWDRLAEGLAGHNDGLAAELRVRSILGRAALEGVDLRPPAGQSVRLALARAWVDSGRFVLAGKLLREMAPEITDHDSTEFIELSSLLAECLEGEGRPEEAESHWRAAATTVDARLAASDRSGPAPADVDRSLRLHLRLAENFMKRGQILPEAEIELLVTLGHLEDMGVKDLADYPAAGRVYLRLATLVRDMNRPGESAAYRRRAKAGAEALLGRTTDSQARRELRQIIAEADSQERPIAGPAPEKPPLPAADMLRLELAALEVLGRVDEFQLILGPVLTEAADRFGPLTLPYMRYYSLKLKWLEESGRVEELTGELRARADQPPGRSEAERALNRAGALIYAAKVNEEAGRRAVAVELYQKALTGLEGRTEPILADRREMIEAALAGLTATAENPAQPGSK